MRSICLSLFLIFTAGCTRQAHNFSVATNTASTAQTASRIGWTKYHDIWRLRTPNGWLVQKGYGNSLDIEYIPDKNHEW